MSAADKKFDLVLWRHAEAEDGAPDSARRLTAHGVKQAESMAEWLASRLPGHYRLLCSPAVRAQQTAQALTRDFFTDARIAVGAGPEEVLAAAQWELASGVLVLVGHQPTLGQTASLLLCGTAYDWSVKKSGVWWISRRAGGILLRAVMAPSLV